MDYIRENIWRTGGPGCVPGRNECVMLHEPWLGGYQDGLTHHLAVSVEKRNMAWWQSRVSQEITWAAQSRKS